MSLEQIKAAIRALPVEEVYALSGWLQEYRWERWDEQLAEDLETGRLDKFLEKAKEEYRQGLARPL